MEVMVDSDQWVLGSSGTHPHASQNLNDFPNCVNHMTQDSGKNKTRLCHSNPNLPNSPKLQQDCCCSSWSAMLLLNQNQRCRLQSNHKHPTLSQTQESLSTTAQFGPDHDGTQH